MPTHVDITPEVGGIATIHYVTDAYPLSITRVSPSGKTFWAKPIDTSGMTPAYYNGPYPVMETFYTQEEALKRIKDDKPEVRVYQNKRGSWRQSGSPTIRVSVGQALCRINYSV